MSQSSAEWENKFLKPFHTKNYINSSSGGQIKHKNPLHFLFNVWNIVEFKSCIPNPGICIESSGNKGFFPKMRCYILKSTLEYYKVGHRLETATADVLQAWIEQSHVHSRQEKTKSLMQRKLKLRLCSLL